MMLKGFYLGLLVGLGSLTTFLRAVFVVYRHRPTIMGTSGWIQVATQFLEGLGIGFVIMIAVTFVAARILARVLAA